MGLLDPNPCLPKHSFRIGHNQSVRSRAQRIAHSENSSCAPSGFGDILWWRSGYYPLQYGDLGCGKGVFPLTLLFPPCHSHLTRVLSQPSLIAVALGSVAILDCLTYLMRLPLYTRPAMAAHSLSGCRILVRHRFFLARDTIPNYNAAQLNIHQSIQPTYAGHTSIFASTFVKAEPAIELKYLRSRSQDASTLTAVDNGVE